jgi:hypothetical protein
MADRLRMTPDAVTDYPTPVTLPYTEGKPATAATSPADLLIHQHPMFTNVNLSTVMQ